MDGFYFCGEVKEIVAQSLLCVFFQMSCCGELFKSAENL
jgi:hypothetical protein